MILDCDIGNTRCKWRLVDDGRIVQCGCFPNNQSFDELGRLTDVSRIRVASVVADKKLESFREGIAPLAIEPEFAKSVLSASGVTNAYREPEKLGVDRWLALVAGFKRQQAAVLVIDAGTALKADLVSEKGEHLGGYIVPGKNLMESSLLSGTGKVKFGKEDGKGGLDFGCSTADAVHAGILASQVGVVTIAIAEANKRLSAEFDVLLTGGDAAAIAKALPSEVASALEVVPELVLDGLSWVLP
jgi:type III pantothenate kinase